MPVKITHLITELSTGGAQMALLRLLTHLDRSRFEPSVVCLYNGNGEPAQRIKALGIPVIDLEMRGKLRLDALWRLYMVLRQTQPTILHTWMFHANLPGRILGRLSGVPIIISSERTMGQESRWRYHLNRISAPLSDRVVCVSQRVADFVTQKVGIPENKVVVIPNGIDTAIFANLPPKNQTRTRLNLPIEKNIVGTITRLTPVKRLDMLLRATSDLPDVHLLIVGDGPEKDNLVQLGQNLQLTTRLHFAGQQNNIIPWLAAMDVCVLASDWEGMPNVILEAMSAGLPVVATAVGGTPEVVIDNETGFLVPPGNPKALAEAIETLLHNPALRHKMGHAGIQRVQQHFTLRQMVERTQTLYEELIALKNEP